MRTPPALFAALLATLGPSAAAAEPAAAELPCRVDVFELDRQIGLPFAEKFKVIAPDIDAQSQRNLRALEERLRAKRPGFEPFRASARARVDAFARELRFEHRTRAGGAEAILASGEVLSLDELARRGIKPAAAKHGISLAETDGVIGQQDVVFLTIGKTDELDYEAGFYFGDVVFAFDAREVLKQGYFSLFPFDHTPGAPRLTPESMVTRPCATAQASASVERYRRSIFSGEAAFRELLTLALAEASWERRQDFGRARSDMESAWRSAELVNERIQALQVMMQAGGGDRVLEEHQKLMAAKIDLRPLAPYFSRLGQPLSAGVEVGTGDAWLIERQWLPRVRGEFATARSILGSALAFPSAEGDVPAMTSAFPGFWEHKVPTRLSLTHLTSVSVSEGPELPRVDAAARAYAVRARRKLSVRESKGRRTYSFD